VPLNTSDTTKCMYNFVDHTFTKILFREQKYETVLHSLIEKKNKQQVRTTRIFFQVVLSEADTF